MNNKEFVENRVNTTTEFHYRIHRYTKKRIKIMGSKYAAYYCKVCKELLPNKYFNSKGNRNILGIFYLRKICTNCEKKEKVERENLRRNSPPKPERCNNCHKKIKKLELDHNHYHPYEFRGWLCKDCNIGIGNLGDDLEGVLQAGIYLENDIEKIIETLNKVFNEMFARKYD